MEKEKEEVEIAQEIFDLGVSYYYGNPEENILPDDEKALEQFQKLSNMGYREGSEWKVKIIMRKGFHSKFKAALHSAKKIENPVDDKDEIYNQCISLIRLEDYESAYEKAQANADNGHVLSMLLVAYFAAADEYYAANLELYEKYLTMAATCNVRAQFLLGLYYLSSDCGDAIDLNEAKKWFTLANQNHDPNALQKLKQVDKLLAQQEVDDSQAD